MTAPLPANRYVWFFSIAIAGLWIDLGSKNAVFESLGWPGKSQWVQPLLGGWSTFQLFTSVNEGALWGIGQGFTSVFAALSVLAIGAVLVWLFKYQAAQSLWLTISLGFVMSGTLGNLFDRLGMHGLKHPVNGGEVYGVRDFLLFTFGDFNWPIFNFADVFLVTGAIMLGVHSLKAEVQNARPALAASDVTQAAA